MPAQGDIRALRELSKRHGIGLAYKDAFNQRRYATPDVLIRVLQGLRVGLKDNLSNLKSVIKEDSAHTDGQFLEPVYVAWEGRLPFIPLRFPQKHAGQTLSCELKLESGESYRWKTQLSRTLKLPRHIAPSFYRHPESSYGHPESSHRHPERSEGSRHDTTGSFTLRVQDDGKKRVQDDGGAGTGKGERKRRTARPFPSEMGLPLGYHTLTLALKSKTYTSLIISAPIHAYGFSDQMPAQTWGLFLPLYACHSKNSWGVGDYSDLKALTLNVSKQGGGVVATTPLLACFYEKPFKNVSPYSPVSRFFWNELFIDVSKNELLSHSPKARSILASPEFEEALSRIRDTRLVDYERCYQLKKNVLRELTRTFLSLPAQHRQDFDTFVKHTPDIGAYADFRIMCDKTQTSWRTRKDHDLTACPSVIPAPASARAGSGGIHTDCAIGVDPHFRGDDRGLIKHQGTDGLREGNEIDRGYYLYTQWLAHQQIQACADRTRSGCGLYLDFPVGVHPEGFDAWQHREIFMDPLSVGAPPDTLFVKGQDWGFRPLHPQRLREQGYHYFISALRHQLRFAKILRLDHVMGLHRLFCIPTGEPATRGVYVHYNPQEFYAIINLESHRHQTVIVGEDLGTVPAYIRKDMDKHRLQRMYVLQYELNPTAKPPLPHPTPTVVASLNTHDMPPLARFLKGGDIEDRVDLGLLTSKEQPAAMKLRKKAVDTLATALQKARCLRGKKITPQSLLHGSLRFMQKSKAPVLMINAEDLWLEPEPQNIPGTTTERPNWKRKSRYSLESLPWPNV